MRFVDYEAMVILHPSFACVFSCVYCGRHQCGGSKAQAIDIPKVIQRLDKLNKTLLVSLCGGEPFLIPNLTEFVAELTQKHYVRIDTNLALAEPFRKFLNNINPRKVTEIVFSTHILEREKRGMDLSELISLVQEAQAKNFRIVGNYVAYPPLMGRLEQDVRFLASHGVTVLPILFMGKFNGKSYPTERGRLSYSQEEFDLITRLNPYAKLVVCNPHNEFCEAGSAAFCVNEKWEVFPCLTLNNKLGDFFGKWKPFPKVVRCPMKYCSDQYNKAFACTLNGETSLSHLFIKAISEKGPASRLESFWFLRKHCASYPLQRIKYAIEIIKQAPPSDRMKHALELIKYAWFPKK